MTVSTATSRVDYTGNGITTTFAVPFPFIEDSYLTVIRTAVATGVETTLVLNSGGADGYTVTGAGDASGSVTVVTAPTGGQRLSVIRAVPGTQEADFVANDPFPAETFENSLDKLQMQINDNATRASRSPVLYDSDIDGSGRYNSNGNRYANAADGVSANDLATVQQITSAGSGSFVQSGAGSVIRTMQDKARDIVSVLDFIPTNLHAGIRSATNTTALRDYIEAAIDSRSGDVLVEIEFPPGSYYIGGDPIRINRNNITLHGYTAGISSDSATANHIEIGDGVTARSNINIIGLTFEKTVVSTAGYAVKMDLVTNARIEQCVFFGNNNMFGGVWAHRTIRVKIINNDGENFAANGKGVLWTGTAANQSIDLHVRDNEFYTISGGIGVDVQDYCEGLYCRQNTFFACGAAGISLAGASEAATLLSGKIDMNDFDSCGFGIYTNYFDNFSINCNWFSANTGPSIRLDSDSSAIVITGNQIYGNGQNGIQCEADDVNIAGNIITACADGVALGANCVNATITGNSINGNSGYGVNLLSNPTNVTVVGNTVRGNTVANISGGGVNTNIASNLVV